MLNQKEEKIYKYIKKFIKKNSYPPAVRDILRDLDFRSTATVHTYIAKLVEKGYLKKDNKKTRALKLVETKEDKKVEDSMINESTYLKVPLIGDVAAGAPILAEENIEEVVALPMSFIKNKRGQETYMLRVKGESMINIGIYDKDYIIVEKTSSAVNGETVVALIEDEATVKTYYKEKDHIRLQPENDNMEPIIVKDVKIIGKVIGLFRKM